MGDVSTKKKEIQENEEEGAKEKGQGKKEEIKNQEDKEDQERAEERRQIIELVSGTICAVSYSSTQTKAMASEIGRSSFAVLG